MPIQIVLSFDHLDLPVAQSLVERPRDGRPSQVVRRELPDPAVVPPARDDVLDHPGRERLVDLECSVVCDRLKEIGLAAAAMKIPPAILVEFEIVLDRGSHIVRQRQGPFLASFDLEPEAPPAMAPVKTAGA